MYSVLVYTRHVALTFCLVLLAQRATAGPTNCIHPGKAAQWLETPLKHAFVRFHFSDGSPFPDWGSFPEALPYELIVNRSAIPGEPTVRDLLHQELASPPLAKHLPLLRWLAEMGVFIGMTEEDLLRYQQNPKGIEFQTLSRVRDLSTNSVALAFFKRLGIFTTLQLFNATRDQDLKVFFAELDNKSTARIYNTLLSYTERLQDQIRADKSCGILWNEDRLSSR